MDKVYVSFIVKNSLLPSHGWGQRGAAAPPAHRRVVVLVTNIKPGGARASDGTGGFWGALPPEEFLNLRRSNMDIQLLLSPREKKISDYRGIKM